MQIGDEVVVTSKGKAGEIGIVEKFLASSHGDYVTLRMSDNSLFFTLVEKVEVLKSAAPKAASAG